IHRLTGELAIHAASGAGALSGQQVSSITPQGLALLSAPVSQAIVESFSDALPPIFAYLVPAAAVAFLLALALRETPLRADVPQDDEGVPSPKVGVGGPGTWTFPAVRRQGKRTAGRWPIIIGMTREQSHHRPESN